MAGHSKWANIRHRKAAQDAKRGKVFTKIIRELVVAAKQGGGNPEDNPGLRAVIDKALSANMKRDTIEKAIQRGTGGGDDANLDELTYEGYGPGGVAIYVTALSDNRNRTVSDVRHAFTKHGGNLGTDGSVAYLFNKVGHIVFGEGADEDQIMELALDAGAEDVVGHEDGTVEVITAPNDYLAVKEALAEIGTEVLSSEITQLPSTKADLSVEEGAKVLRLIDRLEDLDDVQDVYSNANIPAESYELL
ncbi:YebC/PmpR family DNA-binding transcriptional regulator [Litoribrevibacter albus]|uniref:Probable transcriptional regulatory protein GCM10007876_17280 n=1 Tax=Litoribrevibacter albus TaxID=1473156 RepID=A0AA37SAV4_9GAMM|nr:YebC/PmpR family DNA-binding transcriptional regulator [Litoribrevibacter albus]GLQ31249.1 putative transcriptional regulatory protein YebC [Litoribrevibacter albus]